MAKRSRIQLDVNEQEAQLLKRLADKLSLGKVTRTYREALRLLAWYVDYKEKGYTVFAEKNGEKIELDLQLGSVF